MTESFKPKTQIEASHLRWLGQFDPQHKKNWIDLYHNSRDAAVCEAEFREMLEGDLVSVEPYEDLSGQARRPDFRCLRGDSSFFAEVTCILPQTAERRTGIPESVGKSTEPWTVRSLNIAIGNECKQKLPQCSGLPEPCLLAIGTFHLGASCLLVEKEHVEEMLTGPERYRLYYDPVKREFSDGPHAVVDFNTCPFTKLLQLKDVKHERGPISAILLAGLGCNPANVFGILHPQPVRSFDPTFLPSIPFCSLQLDMETGRAQTNWTEIASTE